HRYTAGLLPGEARNPELAAEQAEAPLGQPPPVQMLRHALRWPSNALHATVRVAIGVAVSGLVAWAAGVGHGAGAMAAAMRVLHAGLDRRNTAIRSALRLVGTTLGLGVFLLIHATAASSRPWLLVVIVVVLQGLIELF